MIRLPLYFCLMRLFIVLAVHLLLASCASSTKRKERELPDHAGAGHVPAQASPDSMDVIFYDKPFTDPERYTRFFRVTRAGDPPFTASLRALLLLPGVKEDSLRKCMSEGKILIPLGGDAFRTVYFSRAAKPCEYLYVIRGGAFFYYEMPDSLRHMLDENEKTAREPLPAADH